MSLRSRVLVVALLATLLPVGLGVALDLGGERDTPAARPTSTPTETPPVTLSDLDTRTTSVLRMAFCEAVPADAVERALGAPAEGITAYADGQPAQVTREVRDISHEFGCGWTTTGVTVRAWIFAPPVTPDGAAELVSAARDAEGCRALEDAADFGSTSVGLACATDRGTRVSYRGLFGDAWLACSIEARTPPAELALRTDEWCAAVVQSGGGEISS